MTLKKRWTIYMIHHSHLDVGYTHTAAEISARYTHFLDDILSEIDAIRAGKEETERVLSFTVRRPPVSGFFLSYAHKTAD